VFFNLTIMIIFNFKTDSMRIANNPSEYTPFCKYFHRKKR